MSARFEQETTLHAPQDVVAAAARSFAAESLARWQLADTPDGFEAKGNLGAHGASANFRIESAASGTRVSITLLVERAGVLGFMLFDIGGFYDGTIRKWLDAIRLRVGQATAGGSPSAATAPPPPRKASPGAKFILYCIGFCYVTFVVVIGIWAVAGLITGDLHVPGSRPNTGFTLHGIWARIVSVALLCAVFPMARVLVQMKHQSKSRS